MAAGTLGAQLPTNTSNADFRLWGQSVSTGIQNAGFTATSDTGQINWSTVSAPGGANTKAGYEVYKFADTLAGSHPLYFRVDYGSAGVASTPALWLTVGTGSDGAGNITNTGGTVFGPQQIIANTNTASTAYQGYYSGANSGSRGRLAIAVFAGTAATNATGSYGMYFGIERGKDVNGNDVGTLAYIFCAGSGSSNLTEAWAVFMPGVTQPTIETSLAVILPKTATSMIQGANVGISAPIPLNPAPQYAGINWLVGMWVDYTEWDTWSYSVGGNSYTWLVAGVPTGYNMASIAKSVALIMNYT